MKQQLNEKEYGLKGLKTAASQWNILRMSHTDKRYKTTAKRRTPTRKLKKKLLTLYTNYS